LILGRMEIPGRPRLFLALETTCVQEGGAGAAADLTVQRFDFHFRRRQD
jgi:hypothetical protein